MDPINNPPSIKQLSFNAYRSFGLIEAAKAWFFVAAIAPNSKTMFFLKLN